MKDKADTKEPVRDDKQPATPPAGGEDLSKEIEHSMDRKPNERIKVVRLFDNCYRCNWWTEDKKPQAFWLTTGTISKSSFLRVTRGAAGLQIVKSTEPMARKGPR
jgi:hypothetical protein